MDNNDIKKSCIAIKEIRDLLRSNDMDWDDLENTLNAFVEVEYNSDWSLDSFEINNDSIHLVVHTWRYGGDNDSTEIPWDVIVSDDPVGEFKLLLEEREKQRKKKEEEERAAQKKKNEEVNWKIYISLKEKYER